MPAYTVKTLAAEWSCSTRHIYDLIDSGRLRAFTIGGKCLRIREEEVRRWESRDEKPEQSIEPTMLPSAGAEHGPSLTYMTKALASARG